MAYGVVIEVVERVLADGSIELPLDCRALDKTLIAKLKAGNYEAVAVCLLNAYVNPVHEEALAQMVAEQLPELHVSLSSKVSREFREFERASTCLLYTSDAADE